MLYLIVKTTAFIVLFLSVFAMAFSFGTDRPDEDSLFLSNFMEKEQKKTQKEAEGLSEQPELSESFRKFVDKASEWQEWHPGYPKEDPEYLSYDCDDDAEGGTLHERNDDL